MDFLKIFPCISISRFFFSTLERCDQNLYVSYVIQINLIREEYGKRLSCTPLIERARDGGRLATMVLLHCITKTITRSSVD